ncbi:hypothetical protein ACC691_37825, partial [Rhizobium johnstonii]|uniref:hypothetical protein n=1 Tax=Rhizobium johnstonii TaxID=3019933 RepID=UPI003F9AEE90
DAIAWRDEFGVAKDVSQLELERNVFRYRPVPVTVRLSEDGSLVDALRVIAAAVLARSPFTVSSAVELPARVRELLSQREVGVSIETDARGRRPGEGAEPRGI